VTFSWSAREIIAMICGFMDNDKAYELVT